MDQNPSTEFIVESNLSRLKTLTYIMLAAIVGLVILIILLWLRYSGIRNETSQQVTTGDKSRLELSGSQLSLSNGNTVDLSLLAGGKLQASLIGSDLNISTVSTGGSVISSSTVNIGQLLQNVTGPQGPVGSKGSTSSPGATGGTSIATAQNGTVLNGSTLELGVNPLLHDTVIPQGGNDFYLDASVNNGSFIAIGDPATIPNILSNIPGPGNPLAISGPGERLIWYPRKMALRAGAIDNQPLDFSPYGGGNYAAGTGWDDANIGIGSMAIGYNTIANGTLSTAIGADNDAEGSFNSILGAFNVVSGQANVAIGGLNQLLGNNSINLGLGQLGFFGGTTCFTKTTGNYDFNVGTCNDLKASNSTVIGKDNVVGLDATQLNMFVVGNTNNVTAPDVIVMGENNTVSGTGFAALIGKNSGISGTNSLGIGVGVQVDGSKSFAIGQNITLDSAADNTFGVNVDDTSPVTMSHANVIGFFGGNVGVNTENPLYKFHVSDTSTNQTAAFTGTTQTCIVDTSGPGGWNCTSDERLKTNIAGLNGGLDAIMQLRGVTYNFKSNSTTSPITGFIAQEVQKVLPELVGKDVNGYLNLNKEGMIPYIVTALQQQNGRIDDTNKQLIANGTKVDTVSQELLALTKRVDQHNSDIVDLKNQVQQLNTRLQKLEPASTSSAPLLP